MLQLSKRKVEIVMMRMCMDTLDLANKTGLSRQTIINSLNHKTKIRIKNIGLIAKALNVDVDTILEDSDINNGEN